MKIYSDIVQFLESPIPGGEVATRSGGGAKKLSYLETWKVIDLLNEAFGNLGWDSETTELEQLPDTALPSYRAKVRLTALVKVNDNNFVKVIKEGYGWGSDKSALNSHEMAVKEAESDALKRAAMKFGKRLGLALYDKTQEHVIYEEKPVTDIPEPRPPRTSSIKVTPLAAKEPSTSSQDKSGEVKYDRPAVNRLIRQVAKVLMDKKTLSQPEVIEIMKSYNSQAQVVEDLADSEANSMSQKLQALLKGEAQ